jgi:hypothetical protein
MAIRVDLEALRRDSPVVAEIVERYAIAPQPRDYSDVRDRDAELRRLRATHFPHLSVRSAALAIARAYQSYEAGLNGGAAPAVPPAREPAATLWRLRRIVEDGGSLPGQTRLRAILAQKVATLV